MIPEAAVEAAVEVLWDKEVSARDARAALEAAAPHMLAEAWDASAKATTDFELEYQNALHFCGELPDPPVNPYRPAE